MNANTATVAAVIAIVVLIAEGASPEVEVRAAPSELQVHDGRVTGYPVPVVMAPLPLAWRSLRKRDIRDQLWGPKVKVGRANSSNNNGTAKSKTPTRPKPQRRNSLGELRDDIMVHGRDRDQLRRRWKIEDGNNRVANVHG